MVSQKQMLMEAIQNAVPQGISRDELVDAGIHRNLIGPYISTMRGEGHDILYQDKRYKYKSGPVNVKRPSGPAKNKKQEKCVQESPLVSKTAKNGTKKAGSESKTQRNAKKKGENVKIKNEPKKTLKVRVGNLEREVETCKKLVHDHFVEDCRRVQFIRWSTSANGRNFVKRFLRGGTGIKCADEMEAYRLLLMLSEEKLTWPEGVPVLEDMGWKEGQLYFCKGRFQLVKAQKVPEGLKVLTFTEMMDWKVSI